MAAHHHAKPDKYLCNSWLPFGAHRKADGARHPSTGLHSLHVGGSIKLSVGPVQIFKNFLALQAVLLDFGKRGRNHHDSVQCNFLF